MGVTEQPPPIDSEMLPGEGGASPATALWIIGGLETVLFGTCAGCAAVIATTGLPEMPSELPPGVESMEQLQAAMALLAGGVGVLVVVPGLVLLALGFAVRRGSVRAAKAGRVILLVQAVVIGVFAGINVVAGLAQGAFGAAVVQVVIWGGLLAVLMWGVRTLKRVQPRSRSDADLFEPWNSHLPR